MTWLWQTNDIVGDSDHMSQQLLTSKQAGPVCGPESTRSSSWPAGPPRTCPAIRLLHRQEWRRHRLI